MSYNLCIDVYDPYMTRMWKVKVAMSVLIDKSVCPHASGQRTAMHVCDER